MSNFTDNKRARVGPSPSAMEAILGPNKCENLLQPLHKTKGLLFPYTPDVLFGGQANYDSFHFTHSNYPHWQYQNSAPSEISVTGMFTAQTNEEGRYLIAAIKFLRASTMIEFGLQAARRGVAGTPPPVLRFNYMGGYMFNNVPVVLTTFQTTFERDVDYVEIKLPNTSIDDPYEPGLVQVANRRTYVPTRIMMTIIMQVQHNPKNIRENFDLDKFKRGDLINRGFV